MSSKLTLIAAALLLGAALCGAEEPPGYVAGDSFAVANRSYASGDFEAAREGYETMVKNGTVDPAVFLNLGHSDFRLGRDVEAAINYRRALALEPGNASARSGLERAMQKIGLPAPGLGFGEIVAGYVPFDVLAALGTAAFWAGILAVLYGVFAPGRRTALVAAGVLAALAGATAMAISWAGDSRVSLARTLVVAGDQAVARNAPAGNSQKLCDLPRGTAVSLIASRDGWALVRLPLGVDGWVPEPALVPVVPGRGEKTP